jgi:hypothetical protein
MQRHEGQVKDFLEGTDHEIRRRDAMTLVDLMKKATGERPRLWGSILGFGQYDYRYDSGREGTAPAAGFSPRKAATTIYLADGVGAHDDLLQDLGPHTTGVGCIYVKNLESVDLDILSRIVSRSYETLTRETYTKRAREGTTPGS